MHRDSDALLFPVEIHAEDSYVADLLHYVISNEHVVLLLRRTAFSPAQTLAPAPIQLALFAATDAYHDTGGSDPYYESHNCRSVLY